MYSKPRFLPAGDKAVMVEFGNEINEETNKRVRDVFSTLQQQKIEGIVEMVPTYCSLLIYYDPLSIAPGKLQETVLKLMKEMGEIYLPPPKTYKIPVVYGGSYGPDLPYVAEYNGLSEEEVINTHTKGLYRIYMLGFTPGFCYLGGMDPSIATPRLENPRASIPSGSVGIAGKQTGIYPIKSPGGWQVIGMTPLKIFNPQASSPFLLSAGNYLCFIRIDEKHFTEIKGLVEKGKYSVETEEVEW